NGLVSCWEIGNEVNGSWTGDPQQVREKVRAALEIVSGAKLLTLYLDPEEPDPWEWSEGLPNYARDQIEWVGLSYYGEDLSEETAQDALKKTRALFPHADLLISECGFEKKEGAEEIPEKDKRRRWLHYYSALLPILETKVAGFIGGGFWWNAWDDRHMIPNWI